MTPKELLSKLVSCKGECFRLCSYCPEEFDTAEVKKCVEDMIAKIYQLQQDKVRLMVELLTLMDCYKAETGKEYHIPDEDHTTEC